MNDISKGDAKSDDVDTSKSADKQDADNSNGDGIYNFKDNKTSGTVTVTKKWDDGLTNDEREIPDISISTKKPHKFANSYMVTFHGNGLKFADKSDTNEVLYSGSGQILDGTYLEPYWASGSWYLDEACTRKADISNDGVLNMTLSEDIDLWAKDLTPEIKGGGQGYGFNSLVPSTVTTLIFTDEIKPVQSNIIDVDADGDGGVIAWLDDAAGTIMKISTQVKYKKVQAAKYSYKMLYDKSNITSIDFGNFDTANTKIMSYMFAGCSKLKEIDLSTCDMNNAIDMDRMFAGCSNLTKVYLPKSANNVEIAEAMFVGCVFLSDLKLMSNLPKLSIAQAMFNCCENLTSIVMPSTGNRLKDVSYMFGGCTNLRTVNFSNVVDSTNLENMCSMFTNCTSLNDSQILSYLNTQNVTNMDNLFGGCTSLTKLNLQNLNTNKVTSMNNMFGGCTNLNTLITGAEFKFVGTDYGLTGIWKDASGQEFTAGTFPSNKYMQYKKV